MKPYFAAALSLLCGTAFTAETFREIRIEGGATPGPASVRDDFKAGPGSTGNTGVYFTDLKKSYSWYESEGYVSGTLAPGAGFIWGAGLEASGGSPKLENPPSGYNSFRYTNLGVYGYLAYGHQIGSSAHIEIGPTMSGGESIGYWYEGTPLGAQRAKTSGYYAGLGLRGGAYYCPGQHFVLGIDGGFMHTEVFQHANYSSTGGSSRISWISNRPFFGISTAYRF